MESERDFDGVSTGELWVLRKNNGECSAGEFRRGLGDYKMEKSGFKAGFMLPFILLN